MMCRPPTVVRRRMGNDQSQARAPLVRMLREWGEAVGQQSVTG